MVRQHRAWSSVHIIGSLCFVGLGAYIGFAPGFILLLGVYAIAYALTLQKLSANFVKSLSSATLITATAVTVIVIGLAIQAVPYGRSHAQGPITGEPQWANSETRDLMVRACFGCHSNEVKYPSYASVAPISWMVQSHIDEGREKVNYSEFATNPRGARRTLDVVKSGWMPPGYYTRFGRHPEARLTSEEMKTLLEGLAKTPGLTRNGS